MAATAAEINMRAATSSSNTPLHCYIDACSHLAPRVAIITQQHMSPPTALNSGFFPSSDETSHARASWLDYILFCYHHIVVTVRLLV